MTTIVFCGCGSLGSRIAFELSSPEMEFYIWDDDIVKSENIGTSMFSRNHIGARKPEIMAEMIWRKSDCTVYSFTKTLTRNIFHERFIENWQEGDLIICTFDNQASRNLCLHPQLTTVQVGLSAGRTGSVVWDEVYGVPAVDFERGVNPVCTNALGVGIIRLTATVACAAITEYLLKGEKNNYSIQESMVITKW